MCNNCFFECEDGANKVEQLLWDGIQEPNTLFKEPELRDEFILRMRDIDFENEIMVEDFSKRYGLNV